MDALDLLIADHNRVRGLFAQFSDAKDIGRTDEMGTLATAIVEDLLVHMAIEEEIFYPWCRDRSEEIAEVVDEGTEEHHQVKVLIGELTDLDVADDTWVAKLTVVIEDIEHHADEEESDMFPKVRSHSTADERREIGERLDARKGELGAPTLAETIGLTSEELHRLATEQSIPGRSTMNHDELAATVAPT